MEQLSLYKTLYSLLKDKLILPPDKPDETIDSTLKALWLKACGNSVASGRANDSELPKLTTIQINVLNELIASRLNGTPLAYITGRQCFMGLELISDQRALIPRIETEMLAAKAIDLSILATKKKSPVTVFDLCCGSGNIAISLACNNSNAIVHASDLSGDAVSLAKENISLHGLMERVHCYESDLFNAFESDLYYYKIDLIVCNPPYISSGRISKLGNEIYDNEPEMAFNGGMIGFNVIQKLIRESPRFLSEDAWLVFEVGAGQGNFVKQMVSNVAFYKKIETVSDEKEVVRVIACSAG